MSLLRTVIRATAVGALRDQTWAQDRVSDSDMTPIATAVYGGGRARPYILVYTDRDDITPVTGKAELYNGQTRLLQLVLEIGVASAVRDPTGKLTLQIAATDEGMELSCDIISAQALAALVGDPRSPWGNLFKQMARKVHRILTVRGGQSGAGVKFAARRIIIVMSTIFDAIPGTVLEPKHPIMQFIALANSNPYMHVKDTADIIQPLLTNINAPTWRQAQAYLGLDTEAVKHLVPDGTPLPWPEQEEAPLDYTDLNEYVPPLTELETPDDDNEEQPWLPLTEPP
jgi:hypothetical protein